MKEYSFNIDTTHHRGIAAVGETVAFSAMLQEYSSKINRGIIRWRISRNGGTVVSSGETPSSSFCPTVRFVPELPGYYKCIQEGIVGDEVVRENVIGVLVDPKQIVPSLPVPSDFREFWQKRIDIMRNVPMEVRRTEFESSDTVSVSDIQINCYGNRPVSGILLIPGQAEKRSRPAVLNLDGAGVRTAGCDLSACLAERGFITLDVNAHGIPNRREPEYYHKLNEKELAEYFLRGFDSGDRESVYMLGVFLRCVRAIDYLTSLPEWDGRNLFLLGGSQGAWQCLAGAALSGKVTGAAVSIPAGCDLWSGGWPFNHLTGKTDKPETLKHMLPYFDCCGFCSEIRNIPVQFFVGLADEVCRADGVLAAYNLLATPRKKLLLDCRMKHEWAEAQIVAQMEFLSKMLI